MNKQKIPLSQLVFAVPAFSYIVTPLIEIFVNFYQNMTGRYTWETYKPIPYLPRILAIYVGVVLVLFIIWSLVKRISKASKEASTASPTDFVSSTTDVEPPHDGVVEIEATTQESEGGVEETSGSAVEAEISDTLVEEASETATDEISGVAGPEKKKRNIFQRALARTYTFQTTLILFMLYMGLVLMSIAVNGFTDYAVHGHYYTKMSMWTYIANVTLFLLFSSLIYDERVKKFLVSFLCYTATLYAIYAMMEYYWQPYRGSLSGTFHNSNHYGYFLAVSIALTTAMIVEKATALSVRKKEIKAAAALSSQTQSETVESKPTVDEAENHPVVAEIEVVEDPKTDAPVQEGKEEAKREAKKAGEKETSLADLRFDLGLWCVMMFIQCFALGYNNTLGVWIAVLFSHIFLFIVSKLTSGKFNFRVLIPFGIFLSASIISSFFTTSIFTSITRTVFDVENIMAGVEQADEAGSGRWLIWRLTVKHILERPLFGNGIEGLLEIITLEGSSTGSPHNEFLEYTAFFGVPAGLAYLFGCFSVFLHGLKYRKELNAITVVCMAGAFSYLVSSFFGVCFYYTVTYPFIFMGLALNFAKQDKPLSPPAES